MRGREEIMRPYNVNGVGGGKKRVDKIEGRDGVKKKEDGSGRERKASLAFK